MKQTFRALVIIFVLLMAIESSLSISDINSSNNNMSIVINVSITDLTFNFAPIVLKSGLRPIDFNASVRDHIGFLNSTYPLATIDFSTSKEHFSNFEDSDTLILLGFAWAKWLEGASQDRTIGVFSSQKPFRGLSMPLITNTVIVREDSLSSTAHEIGHTFDLCDEYNRSVWSDQNLFKILVGGCPNAKGPDGNFREGCKDTTVDFGVTIDGCPVENQKIIKDLHLIETNKQLVNFMGGSPSASASTTRWVNNETYKIIYNEIMNSPPDFEDIDFVIIVGAHTILGDFNLAPFYTVRGGFRVRQEDYNPGNLTLVVKDNFDNIIFNISFREWFGGWEYDNITTKLNESFFLFSVPAENAAKFFFYDNGTLKSSRNITSNTPSVTVSQPNGGEIYNTSFNVTWIASDPDGDSLSYAVLLSNDGGLKYRTLRLNLTQTFLELNDNDFENGTSYVIKVLATDGIRTGNDTSANFTIIQTNVPPILDFIGNKSVQVNSTITIDLNTSDVDNDTLTYSKNVTFGSIDSSTGVFAWTPSAVGNFTVNFTVSDSLAQDSEIISIEVRPILNYPPVLVPIGDKTAFLGKTLSVDVDATDPDNDPLTYGHNATFGDSFNATNGVYNWTPNATGLYIVNFNVTDGNSSDNETIRINVKNLTEAGAFPRIVTNNSLNSTPWRGEHFLVENFENWAIGPINSTSNGFWNTSRGNQTFKGNWSVTVGQDEFGNPTKVLNHTSDSAYCFKDTIPQSCNNYLFVEESALKGRFENFSIQVKMSMQDGGGGGLIFRWNDTSNASGYRIYKSGDTWDLAYMRVMNGFEETGKNLNSSANLVFPNNLGWIRVVFAGEMLYVYNSSDGNNFGVPVIIRNVSQDEVVNRSLTNGTIGLFANSNLTFDELFITEHVRNQTHPDNETGIVFHNENLTGTYLYSDVNGLNQSNVTFRWFRNGILTVTQFNGDLNNINSTIDSSKTSGGDLWQFEVTFCNTAGKCRTEISQKVKIINIAPVMDSLDNVTMFVDHLLTIDVNAVDGNNDVLTYGTNATFGSFNTATGVFTWTPTATGIFRVKFNVSDTEDVTEQTITIKVDRIANETEGRNATEMGVNSSLPVTNRTIFTNQQIYIRYEDDDQKLGKFDKFVNSTSQRWMFNYNFSTNPFTNMTNISRIVNTWERQNMTEENITAETSLFINLTKI